jgi:hypothetical protein
MEKHDISNWSHDPPPQSALARYPVQGGLLHVLALLKDSLIILGGAHPATARQFCPPREVLHFYICGLVLIGTMLMTASTVTSVLHFAIDDGQFHIAFALVGILAGAMQGAGDNLLQYNRKWVERGNAMLRMTGLRLPEVQPSRGQTLFVNLVRGMQGCVTGALAGVCLLLAAMQPATTEYAAHKFRTEQPQVWIESTKQVDGAIARTTEERDRIKLRVDQDSRMISSLRQDSVRRVVRADKRAPSVSAAQGQISGLEAALAADTAELNAVSAKLDRQLADRNAEIARVARSSPSAVAQLSGLSGKLEAVAAITKNDPKLLFFVIAFQVISLALELLPMWLSLSDRFFPSSYAAHVALRSFLEAKKIAEDGAAELGLHSAARRTTTPANDNMTPPRRRGRPPKNDLNGKAEGGQS